MSGPDYSDERFEAVTTEIEELLGDLLGIETAAQMLRDYNLQRQLHPEDTQGGANPRRFTIPASTPFEVWPSVHDFANGQEVDYQRWIDGAFEAGKAGAGGMGPWLRYLADGFYLVDTKAMISSAAQQADLALHHGTQLDQDLADVSGNLAVHWEGDAKEAFFEWFPFAYGVPSALFHYANAAQACVGICAGVIGGAQAALLQQAEHARDALEEALKAWRDDFDQFPFPPGTGWAFKEIGIAIQGKVDGLTEKIPGPDIIVDALTGKAQDKVLSKIPGSGPVMKAYDILTQLEANEVDVKEQPTAQEIVDALEARLRAIAKEGDDSILKLGDRMTALAAELDDADVLVLDRLPRDPQGTYDADAG